MSVTYVDIPKDAEGQRVDNFIFARFRSVPKTLIYRLMRQGSFRVNGKRIKPTTRLSPGDQLRIPPLTYRKALTTIEAPWLEDCILYEDDTVIAINKPANIASQGGTSQSISIIDALRPLRPKDTLYLVHRLDKCTSGCLLIAKGRTSLHFLQSQFEERTIQKTYLTLVHGKMTEDQMVALPLKKEGRVMVVDVTGKASKTNFYIKRSNDQCTLLEAIPHTGRMHQIRAHCQAMGHPIIGDVMYGAKETKHPLFLHAQLLTFQPYLEKKILTLVAPLKEAQQQRIETMFS
jgi:23S rRNA pseudouridine955/2504/2580 synthase